MAERTHTIVLVAALYLSDYSRADLAALRDRARSDVHAVMAELAPLLCALPDTAGDSGTVRAGQRDAARLTHCEFTAYTVLARACVAELRELGYFSTPGA